MREDIKIKLLRNLLEEVTKKYDYFIEQKEKILKETYTLSITDALTSLYNRHYALERFEKELERAIREKASFTLIMLDLDDFKPINDKYGHIKGDEILKKVAEILKRGFRSYDVVSRFGGDEFLIITFQNESVEKHLNELRKKVENILPQENLSFSYGFLKIPDEIEEFLSEKENIINHIIDKVDSLLYLNKKERKKRKDCTTSETL